jgi:hypothetical protein
MRLQFTLALLLICSFVANGQYTIPKKYECASINLKTLAIPMVDSNQTGYVNSKDTLLQHSILAAWKHGPVKFLSVEEFYKIVSSGDSNYVIIRIEYLQSGDAIDHYNHADISKGSFTDAQGRSTLIADHTTFSSYQYYKLLLEQIKRPGITSTLSEVWFTDRKFRRIDFLFGVQQFYLLTEAAINNKSAVTFNILEQNIETINKSTVLIPQEYLHKTNADDFKSDYAFRVSVLNQNEIDSIALNRLNGNVYTMMITMSKQKQLYYDWILVDASNGKIISIYQAYSNSDDSGPEAVFRPHDLSVLVSKKNQSKSILYK